MRMSHNACKTTGQVKSPAGRNCAMQLSVIACGLFTRPLRRASHFLRCLCRNPPANNQTVSRVVTVTKSNAQFAMVIGVSLAATLRSRLYKQKVARTAIMLTLYESRNVM